MVLVVAFFAANKLAIKRECCDFGIFLSFELNPSLYVVSLTVSPGLLARVCDVLWLCFKVDSADSEPFRELLPDVIGVHVRWYSRHEADAHLRCFVF